MGETYTRKRPALNVTVDPSTRAILDGVGNRAVGAYLDRIVEERDREWRAALRILRADGWRAAELLAACDALNGYHALALSGDQLASEPGAITAELQDAAALDSLLQRHDVTPERWAGRLKALRKPGAARALLLLAREFWASNAACDAAIRRAGAES